MAESRPGGDKADPWYADPESEIPSVDEISGYDVILSYGNTYVVVTLKSEGKVQFAYRDAEISPPRITDKPGQDLVWLDLDVRAGYSVVALRLPFYAKDIDRLHAFRRALTVPLSGHAGLAQAQPDDEA